MSAYILKIAEVPTQILAALHHLLTVSQINDLDNDNIHNVKHSTVGQLWGVLFFAQSTTVTTANNVALFHDISVDDLSTPL